MTTMFPEQPEWLSFDTNDLTASYARVAGRISNQGRLVGEAQVAEALAKAKTKQLLGILATKVRAMLKAGGDDAKPSDARVEQAMYKDHFAEVCEAIGHEAGAEAYLTAAKNDLLAVMSERDMLIQAGSDRRNEIKGLGTQINTYQEVARRANLAAAEQQKQNSNNKNENQTPNLDP